MRYEAPDSVDTAVALLAGARGDTRVLAGGTDLLVQMRSDMLDPELIVDIKKIVETRSVTQEKGAWASAPRSPRRAQGKRRAQKGLARRGRGGQPHRVDPGPGPGDHGREPLQWLAGGGQRARIDRGRGPRHGGRAEGKARASGSRTSC